MVRPKSFNNIVGHKWFIDYTIEHLKNGTLPHFIIIEGPEGVGKTALADIIALNLVYGLNDSVEKERAYNDVVKTKRSNQYIKKFELSVDGGKETAKEVRAEMHNTFNLDRVKVIICDECHNLSEAAQDVFLSDTEYTSDDVYLIMLTTESEKLKASLKSRSVPIRLHPLTTKEMYNVLKIETENRRLKIQNESAVLQLIAEWSENKPRTGLNILNAFSEGSSVSSNMIRELIGYMDVRDIVPLLASLAGSMTFGLSYISEMQINQSIISWLVEVIKLKSGESSYKIKMDDIVFIKEQLADVSVEQLVTFLFGLTKNHKLNRTDVINAYISSHNSKELLNKKSTVETLFDEKSQKASVAMHESVTVMNKAPSLEELLFNSSLVE